MEALSAAKEFLSYIDHQDLRYLNTQTNMNQRNMKWVEFLNTLYFFIKHKSGKLNEVVDALSQRVTLFDTSTVQTKGLELVKTKYEIDEDFKDTWKASTESWSVNKAPYLDYFIKEGYLFKGHQLWIPRGSMRENLIIELHSGGLARHFGVDKTKALVEEIYDGLGLATEVQKWVQQCKV